MQKNIVIEKIMTRKTIFAQVWLKELRESLTQNKNIDELLNFYHEEIAPHESTT